VRHQSFTAANWGEFRFADGRESALQPVDLGPVVNIAGLEIRPTELQVFVHGARVNFTVREFETFYALAARCDRVVSRGELYAAVWGGEMPHRDRSVDVFVRKVRRKLAAVSPGWTYVHTHFGIGYRFSPERGTR
jgi:DNA-binding response OmpR family regulator